jgi:hypothetical protein
VALDFGELSRAAARPPVPSHVRYRISTGERFASATRHFRLDGTLLHSPMCVQRVSEQRKAMQGMSSSLGPNDHASQHMKRASFVARRARRCGRWVPYALVVMSSCLCGCLQHAEIDFVAYVRDVAASVAGRDVNTIDNSTRLGELGLQEADLGRLAKQLSEGTSVQIKESDLKGLRQQGSWKEIRLYDIGCFVGRKVLDAREATRRARDKRP